MNVRSLIEQLSSLDPELEVLVWTLDNEENLELVSVSIIDDATGIENAIALI